MRSLFSILMGAAVLLLVSSCASTKPLGEGELRLLKMVAPENSNLRLGGAYRFTINFESDGSADIIRAVCTCADSPPRPYKIEDVRYASKGENFSVWLSACTSESQRMECYVDYVSEGKRRRSNSVYCLVYGL